MKIAELLNEVDIDDTNDLENSNEPDINVPGAQPKPLKISAKPSYGTVGSTATPPQDGNLDTLTNPNVSPNTTPSPDDSITRSSDPRSKNAPTADQIGKQMGMDDNEQQLFHNALSHSATNTGGNQVKTITPQNMQKAMPKPGQMVNVKTMGNMKVLPTPSDERGLKIDTTNKLGYPIIVDPRDIKR